MVEKRCSTCRITKSITEFNKNRTQPHGLNWECRQCVNPRRPCTCQECGTEFPALLTAINKGGGKFCPTCLPRRKFPSLDIRFWKKVNKNGPIVRAEIGQCWIWQGRKITDGYGSIRDGGKRRVTNRVSWEIHNGPIPDGLYVLHCCDNPSCVNPDHLFLGTKKDNSDDMVRKGRGAFQRTKAV